MALVQQVHQATRVIDIGMCADDNIEVSYRHIGRPKCCRQRETTVSAIYEDFDPLRVKEVRVTGDRQCQEFFHVVPEVDSQVCQSVTAYLVRQFDAAAL